MKLLTLLLTLLLTILFCASIQSFGNNVGDGYRLVNYEEVWVKQLFTGEDWINDSKIVNIFSPEGNLLSRTKYLWIDNDWPEYERFRYRYDNRSNKIEESIFGLLYSVWINHVKLVYEYDSLNLEILKTEYNWYDDSLHKAFQFKSIYGESGNLVVRYQCSWGEKGWAANFKTNYSYDESGRKTEELFQSNFDDSLSNLDRTITEYKGDTTQVTKQGWNLSYWFDATRDLTIKRSNDNSKILIAQYPRDSLWINSNKKIYRYNDYDSLIYMEELIYTLDSIVPDKRYFYEFTGGRKVSGLEQIFYDEWRDLYRTVLDTNWGYANKEIITDVTIGFVENDKSTVGYGYKLNKDAYVRIYIANTADEEISEVRKDKQVRGRYEFEFDASNFLQGEYYLVFDASGIRGRLKLPKQ